MKKPLLIGPHLSIAGGLYRAIESGAKIGATTVQIFTANQRTWLTKPISEEDAVRFKEAVQTTGLQKVMSHASYLINLGSPNREVREKSIRALKEELERCQTLGIEQFVVHPGAALDSPVEKCLKTIAKSILSIAPYFTTCSILLETTAGQGSVVGGRFEDLAYIIRELDSKVPVGVCLDTCHIFAAGYDLSSENAVKETVDEFDRVIGLKFLKAIHMNDSKFGLGEHKDRHSLIGEGMIGKTGFSAIMNEPRLKNIPKYLETPGDLDIWEKEMAWLRKCVT